MTIPKTTSLVIFELGGPMFKILVDGKLYDFEMHPYCGPTLLNEKGDPIDLDKHPIPFLEAAFLWAQQGKRMEDGLCRWDHNPEPIIEHVGGNRFKIIGYTEPTKGS